MTVRRLVLVVALALVAAACAGNDKYEPLPVPDDAAGEVTTSTAPPDLTHVALPPVPGTTSTTAVGIGPGPITIIGRVDGPDGPVGGAIVRLERQVGRAVARLDVPTATDGTWNAPNVLGGRYRVRAWLPPSFGMLRAQTVFVETESPKPVVLRVDRFEGLRVDRSLAPDPPLLDEDTNLVVRVVARQVDDQGHVVSTAVSGVEVTLSGQGAWRLRSSNPAFTGFDGTVLFRLVCTEAGSQQLSAVVNDTDVHALDLPACVDESAAATTTTTTEVRR